MPVRAQSVRVIEADRVAAGVFIDIDPTGQPDAILGQQDPSRQIVPSSNQDRYRSEEVGAGGVAVSLEDLAIGGDLAIVGNLTTGGCLEEAVSAAEANRRFSRLLRGVREGRSYVVTSHGRPVARLIPAGTNDEVASTARAVLLTRLEKQRPQRAKRWTREELYER